MGKYEQEKRNFSGFFSSSELTFIQIEKKHYAWFLIQIYWVAPISGALISATTYKYVFRREVIETDDYGQHLETLRDEAGKAWTDHKNVS